MDPHECIAKYSRTPLNSITERFQHERLDARKRQIRLVKLLPLSAESSYSDVASRACPVSCHVYTTELSAFDDDERYIALSYAWEEGLPVQTILMNGSPFVVRQNLYDFLVTMQCTGLIEEPFWIDQLCIDQSFVSERSSQVDMMSEIYSRAAAVYIWLGSATERTSGAMQSIDSLKDACLDVYHTSEAQTDASDSRSDYGALVSTVRQCLLASGNELSSEGLLAEIFGRPYWRRIWIVQEVLLAWEERLLCGLFECLLPTEHSGVMQLFLAYLEDCSRSHWPVTTSENISAAIQMLRHCYVSGHQSSELVDVLTMHIDRLCTDPRNKVFGLQSCVRPGEQVVIDYSLEAENVFTRVAFAFETDGLGSITEDEPKSKRALLSRLRPVLGLDWWSDYDVEELCKFTGYYVQVQKRRARVA